MLEANNVEVRYDTKIVLEDITFEVKAGEIFLIVGGSGCGKTTLLKTLCGLLTPSKGSIRIMGRDITKLDEEEKAEIQQTVGFAFQSSGLINSMTVGDNVALPLKEYGKVPAELIPEVVRIKLSLVGLAGVEEMMPEELSGGMKKRAGLARALALDPPLVFFDEPSAGLDPIIAVELDELILNLRELLGTTFVIVSHELESIKKIADRILMLDNGRRIFCGTLAEVETTNIPLVRQFFERKPSTERQIMAYR
ncbi:MAG: ATP-binding cassette domain-containing protein [Candidatus Hydrogenedentes bacterium]|nr:ATP-binding cassette domain-containing protein [Candidatus Hydrogenedentota bacterium]